MIKDLRGYMAYLSERGRLAKIKEEISPELEITAFTDKADRESRYDSKTLFFEDVKGYEIPVVTNLFGSMRTMEELFKNFYVTEMLDALFSVDKKAPLLKSVYTINNSRPSIANFNARGYETLDSLEELPVLKVWPKDAGKFITLPIVVTESPKDSSPNVGLYRMQVYDGKTTGMRWHAQKGGYLHATEARKEHEKLKVSVCIGSDPFNIVSSVAPLPEGMNEFSFAGITRGSKTLLARNGTYPPFPANSEIIINGYVDPDESRKEGPFGDHTGYYSIPAEADVFHVDRIYAKKGAVYAASVVGFPWHEDAVIGQFLLGYLKPLLSFINKSIVDIYLPPEGVFTNMCFVKIKKRFPGEARKAMFSILGTGQFSFTKIIAAFDEDIDIRDLGSVIWALSTRVEPERDISIISGSPSDSLDHTPNIQAYGSKLMIDATRKSKAEGYSRDWPETISLPKEIIEKVDRKWRETR